MPNHSAELDQVFQALTSPARRRMLERLTRGEAAMSELARPLAMAGPSVLQHLRVLEESGLVRSTKAGRVRTYRLQPIVLRRAQTWLDEQRSVWESRLNRLDAFLENPSKPEPKNL